MQALFVLRAGRQPAARKNRPLSPILHRAAVSHMIVSGDDIAMLRQKVRKLVIAADMLSNAVNQLNKQPSAPLPASRARSADGPAPQESR